LILARDEAAVLGETLIRVRAATSPGDEIHVVADHCRDQTAEIAHAHGAFVHVRSGRTTNGKGTALRWWLERTQEGPHPSEGVVILDADTLVENETLGLIRARLAGGALAVQAFVRPLLRTPSAFGRLAAFSEIVEQKVYDALRTRIGWPVRLRGTGMGFQREALEEIAPLIRTLAEDIELTLHLVARRIQVEWLGQAIVLDPLPADEAGATRQRARWLRGLLEAAAACRHQILRAAAMGPAGWSLLSSLLLKPRSLYFPLKVLLAVSTWAVAWEGTSMERALAWAVTAAAAVEALGWAIGLRYIPDRRETLRALLQTPKFALMWLRSASLARIAREGWLRARPLQGDPAQGEAASAE
jgi:cellulose synthase/poly-beta-1,6-N-acetylglucosamine synthase-like glycosyltransferase